MAIHRDWNATSRQCQHGRPVQLKLAQFMPSFSRLLDGVEHRSIRRPELPKGLLHQCLTCDLAMRNRRLSFHTALITASKSISSS